MMKSLLSIATAMILISSASIAQGFDWQLSARTPVPLSNQFIGIHAGASLSNEFGDFDFYEDDCNCGNFEKGTGANYIAGLAYERWLKSGLVAIRSSLEYRKSLTKFESRSSLPVILPDDTESEIDYLNSYELSLSRIAASIGAKHRIAESHFYGTFDLLVLLNISEDQKHYERILGPDWAPLFPGNPPSRKRLVSSGKTDAIYSLQIVPSFSFGYDLELATGTYSSLEFNIGSPLLNRISRGSWYSFSYGFGFRILKML